MYMAAFALFQQAKAVVSEATAAATPQGLLLIAVVVLTAVYFGRPRKEGELPPWVPLEVGAVGYLINSGGPLLSLYSALRRHGGSLFGLTSTHQVIHQLPNVDKFMSQSHHVLDIGPRDWAISWRVFGSDRSESLRLILDDIAGPFHDLTERAYLNEANCIAALGRADVPGKAQSFVTFSARPDTLALWERDASPRLLLAPAATSTEASQQRGAVEVDLFALVRNFGGHVSVPQLYGQDFLDRNPTVLADLWKFDNDLFPLRLLGLPTWLPLQAMRDGLAARQRLHDALAGLYKRIDQYQNGEPVDFGADMSDVPAIALGRNQGYVKHNLSFKHRGQMDMGLFWGQNANTQPLLSWFLLFIYATPGLVDDLRREIAPYVPVSVDTAPLAATITSMDLRALSKKCPLLKSTMYETFRMANQPTSLRVVRKPITVSDGEHTHQLKRGAWLSAAWSLTHKDPSVYPDPETFKPDRFMETDPETQTTAVRYGRLRPWGYGPDMCKGRVFAEKEMLAISAAIISLWDISPAGSGGDDDDDDDDGKKWVIPGMRPGTGAVLPDRDVRVVVRRRVF